MTDELDDCPERSGPGYTHHTPVCVEQPDDSNVYWVRRCSECGVVFDSYDTHKEFMENEYPEIQFGANYNE